MNHHVDVHVERHTIFIQAIRDNTPFPPTTPPTKDDIWTAPRRVKRGQHFIYSHFIQSYKNRADRSFGGRHMFTGKGPKISKRKKKNIPCFFAPVDAFIDFIFVFMNF